jgi:putative transposase
VIRIQAYRFEIKGATGDHVSNMRRFSGCARYVYNRALALNNERLARGEKHLGYHKLCGELTRWKQESQCAWLNDAPSQTLQQALKNLERAYQNLFEGRAQAPTFKRKHGRQSFRYPQKFKLDQANSRVFLPKLGWLRYRNSRQIEGEACNVTVSSSGDRWFISIQTERHVETPVPEPSAQIGIDVGVECFAALSDGRFIEPIHSFKRHAARLARAQCRRDRKVKFSNNWRKANQRIQRIHRDIANARRDHQHKASTAISKTHAIVYVEDLRVQHMTASAAGTQDSPGQRVKQKSALNRSILDQGWFEFRRQLRYKLAWRGGQLIAVSPAYTSQTCPACLHTAKENRPERARFRCVRCDHIAHADIVGAINILRAGRARLACQANAAQECRQQEPTKKISEVTFV